MKSLKNKLMQLAVLIVLLHSIVPHHHHSEAASPAKCAIENPHSEETLLGFLGEIFHTDLGDDHLENWVHSSQSFISFTHLDQQNDCGFLPFSIKILARTSQAQEQTTIRQHYHCLYSRVSPYRGPPSYILA